MTAIIRALVGCQNQSCSEEVSYHLDMVRMFNGEPICENCYYEGDYGARDDSDALIIGWDALPLVTLADLIA